MSDAQPIDEFHAHLDKCKVCRENPFALCWTGAVLLKKSSLKTALGVVKGKL